MPVSPLNPYSPPAPEIVEIHVSPGSEGLVFRDGKDLWVKSGAALPGICPFTGQVAGQGRTDHSFNLGWNPRWFYAVALTIPASFGLAYLSREFPWVAPMNGVLWPMISLWTSVWSFFRTRKIGKVKGFQSERIRRFNRAIYQLAMTLVLVGAGLLLAMAAGSAMKVPLFAKWKTVELFLDFGFSGIGLGMAALFLIRRLRVSGYRDEWFRIRSCHSDFLRWVPEKPEGR